METIKIKPIAIGELMCLVPIVLGMAFKWALPREIDLLFGFSIRRDFIIFGLPFIMAFVHIFVCLLVDVVRIGSGRTEEDSLVVKVLAPTLNYILYLAIIVNSVGERINYTKIFMFVLGTVLILIAIYALYTENMSLSKLRRGKVRSRQEIRFNRLVGVEALLLGALFSLSVFLDKVFSAIFIVLLIATVIITVALAKTVKVRHRRG